MLFPMSSNEVPSGFSAAQIALYERTGLVFDIVETGTHAILSLRGTEVFTFPLQNGTALHTLIPHVRLPGALSNASPTLVQRHTLLRHISETTVVRARVAEMLAAEHTEGVEESLQRILDLERQTQEQIALLIWTLDDITIQRLMTQLRP